MPRLIVHGFTLSLGIGAVCLLFRSGARVTCEVLSVAIRRSCAALAVIVFCTSCTTTIGPDDYRVVNGLWVSSATGLPLDGKYRLVRPPRMDQFGDKEHLESPEYNKGVPTGQWTYTFGGDLIQSGEYLSASAIKDSITALTGSSRVDIEVFREGAWASLEVHLIRPSRSDSLALVGILDWVNEELVAENRCSGVGIYSMQDSIWKQLYPIVKPESNP